MKEIPKRVIDNKERFFNLCKDTTIDRPLERYRIKDINFTKEDHIGLYNIYLRNCYFEHCSFKEIIFLNGEFIDSGFSNVWFEDCTINQIIFNNSRFFKHTFLNCSLENVSFWNTLFRSSMFDSCDLEKISLELADILTGIDIVAFFKNCRYLNSTNSLCRYDKYPMVIDFNRASLDIGNYLTTNIDDLRYMRFATATIYSIDPSQSIISVGPIGSIDDYTTYIPGADFVRCGCFYGSLEQFERKVVKKYPEGWHHDEYMAAIELFKVCRKKYLANNG